MQISIGRKLVVIGRKKMQINLRVDNQREQKKRPNKRDSKLLFQGCFVLTIDKIEFG